MVGLEEFGFFSSLLSFSFLLNIILDLGLTNYNNRNISRHKHLLSKHFSNIIGIKFLLAIVYAVICFGTGAILGYDSRQFNLLFFLVFNQFLISFTLYLRSNLAGLQLFKTNSFVSVLDRSLMIIFCSVLIWGKFTGIEFNIEWFVYAQTAAYLLTTIICFFLVYYRSEFVRIKFDRVFFIVILKQSYPYALLILLMTVYTRIDQVLLEYILRPDGKEQVGIYVHSFRIFDAAFQFAMLFAVLLLPMFSKMIKQKEAVSQLVQLSFLLLIVPSIVLAFASMFYSGEIMDLLYTKNIAESARFFGIMMFAFVSMSGTIIFGTLLTANGSMKELNWISGIGVIINLVINLILIPSLLAYGSAIACLITQSFVAIAQIIIAKRVFKLKLNMKVIILLVIFTAGVWLLGIFIKQLNLEWYLGFSLLMVTGILFAVITRLLNLRAIYEILKFGDEQ